jgi:hypothetical protein
MRGRRKGPNQIWFNDRVREALAAAEQGRDDLAIDLLDSLAEQCHESAGAVLTEWHEIHSGCSLWNSKGKTLTLMRRECISVLPTYAEPRCRSRVTG